MRRALPIAFAMLSFLLIGRIWSDLQATAQQGGGGAEPTSENMWCVDPNGDSTLDITDAVYILNYLFLGKDAPHCIAQDKPDWPTAIAEIDARLSALESGTFVSVQLSQEQNGIPASTAEDPKPRMLLLDRELADSLDEFDPGTHQFTATNAGVYLVNATASWAGFLDTGEAHFHIWLRTKKADGTEGRVAYTFGQFTGRYAYTEATTIAQLDGGESIDVWVDQWMGGGRTANVYHAELQVIRMR